MVQIFGFLAFFVTVLALSTTSQAATPACTRQQEMAAEDATASTWDAIYRVFEKYSPCDDGAPAERFSDDVTLLLADSWNTAPRLQTLFSRSPPFRAFVIRHIDEAMPEDRWEKIAQNIHARCQPKIENLCRDIDAANRELMRRIRK